MEELRAVYSQYKELQERCIIDVKSADQKPVLYLKP
jgi:hypothetical protein